MGIPCHSHSLPEEVAMESLQTFFEKNGSDIQALGRYIQQHIDENWETVFQQTRQEMLATVCTESMARTCSATSMHS
jgi:hypothetical protein